VTVPKRRRSALETFDGCPYRYDVLYNLCLCGHRRDEHDQATGECCGQTKPNQRHLLKLAGEMMQGDGSVKLPPVPKRVPCDCDKFRPVEDRGDESQRGIAFHEAAFRYIDRLARAGTPADHEEADLAFKEGITLTQLAPHLLPDVRKLWRRHVEHFQLNLNAYLSAEERQETERFTWIPDLVYIFPDNVTIYDWKTYYKGLTHDQALQEFQLKFYLVQAIDIWPNFATYTFVFNFPRLAYEVRITLTAAQIEDFRPEVEAIMLSMDEAARTGNYPAIQGAHCGLCRLACPLADNPVKLPVRFTNLEQAQLGFGRLLMLEQEVKALKKSLEAWCRTEGPVVYRGQEYLHRQGSKRRYPAAAFIDFLRERGTPEELIALITVSKTGLADFGNPRKVVLPVTEFLQEIEQATTTWTFRHRKAGELAPATDDEEHDDE